MDGIGDGARPKPDPQQGRHQEDSGDHLSRPKVFHGLFLLCRDVKYYVFMTVLAATWMFMPFVEHFGCDTEFTFAWLRGSVNMTSSSIEASVAGDVCADDFSTGACECTCEPIA